MRQEHSTTAVSFNSQFVQDILDTYLFLDQLTVAEPMTSNDTSTGVTSNRETHL
jgi:hypothetical protein